MKMFTTDLWREVEGLFVQLEAPRAADVSVVALSVPGYWVGRDHDLRAVLLAPSEPDSRRLRLKRVAFEPILDLRLESSSSLQEGSFAVVTLEQDDLQVAHATAAIVGGLVAGALNSESKHPVYDGVRALASLFSPESETAKKSEMGLWAEMLTIISSSTADVLCEAWADSWLSPIDFYSGGEGLEVKATRGGVRVHHFSSTQLAVCEVSRVSLVSYMLIEDPCGWSIDDLLSAVLGKVAGHLDLQMKIGALITQALGGESSGVRFDLEAAMLSRLIVPLNSVPAVELSAGVVDASWRAIVDDSTLPLDDLAQSCFARSLL